MRQDLNWEECRLYAPPQTVYVVLEVEVRVTWIENKYFINKSQTLSDTCRIVLGIMFHRYYLVNSIDGCFYVFHGMPKGDTIYFTLSFSRVNDNLGSYFWVFHKVPYVYIFGNVWLLISSICSFWHAVVCRSFVAEYFTRLYPTRNTGQIPRYHHPSSAGPMSLTSDENLCITLWVFYIEWTVVIILFF